MRNRRTIMAVGALLALVAIVRHPTADIEILTHRDGDPTPHRIQAAVDLGVVAVKFLLTWTGGSTFDR
ncbi:hypothetical protein [Sphingomonas sp.]|uniref:hypothetical protein n=1 Tax=Sphingomonas sp. TaxID=28214 RepID=UPI0025E8457F|nr:hypothetical protein [Sphingomonas sp.]